MSQRVLLVCGSLGLGGAERQLVLLANGLVQKGWAIRVFCIEITQGSLQYQLDPSIQIVTGRYHSTGSLIGKLAGMVYAAVKLLYLCMAWRPKVVHAWLPLACFLAMTIAFVTLRPVRICARRALGTHQDRVPLWKPLDRWAAALSTVVTANSEAVKLDTVQRDGTAPQKVIVISNAVLAHFFEFDAVKRKAQRDLFALEADTVVIGCIGNRIAYKGHADLIHALAQLRRNQVAWQLLLFGEDRGLDADLAKLIDRLQLSNQVRLLPAAKDVGAVLNALDIFVHPSHEEGFSNAVLEAMINGLDLILSAVGGNVEAANLYKNVRLVPPKNPVVLADVLDDVLVSKAATAPLALRAEESETKKIAQLYSLEKMILAHEALYNQNG
jgi:glycosyltransferase involved in cell wall biosynthesis